MNKCKFCQAEMADNGTFCPVCGRDNREEEIPVVTEPVPAEEIAAQEEAFVEEMPKPSAGKIGLAVAAIVVLVIVREIRNRKKGKCSCGCSGCALKDTCHPQKD